MVGGLRVAGGMEGGTFAMGGVVLVANVLLALLVEEVVVEEVVGLMVTEVRFVQVPL